MWHESGREVAECRLRAQQRRALMARLRAEFRLDWIGIHGVAHWGRVRVNGLRIAALNGARADVVELFALLHDSQRRHDGNDRRHGARAAEAIERMGAAALELDGAGLELLAYACRWHSEGLTEADCTVQTCWDADRLDLGRVGIIPDPARLCSRAAKAHELRRWATERGFSGYVPLVVREEWGQDQGRPGF